MGIIAFGVVAVVACTIAATRAHTKRVDRDADAHWLAHDAHFWAELRQGAHKFGRSPGR